MGAGLLPSKFWAADERGNRGGVEFAFMSELQTYSVTDLKTYRFEELQSYRLTDFQSYRATDLQTYRATELQSYRLTGARLRMKKWHCNMHRGRRRLFCGWELEWSTKARICRRYRNILERRRSAGRHWLIWKWWERVFEDSNWERCRLFCAFGENVLVRMFGGFRGWKT